MNSQPRITCKTCKTTYALNWQCVACCLRWLMTMDRETLAINAPIIKAVAGDSQLQAVRKAYVAAGMVPARESEFKQQRKG